MRTWLIEVLFEGKWMPSLDFTPMDSREEARRSLRYWKDAWPENKYRIRRYVRAD